MITFGNAETQDPNGYPTTSLSPGSFYTFSFSQSGVLSFDIPGVTNSSWYSSGNRIYSVEDASTGQLVFREVLSTNEHAYLDLQFSAAGKDYLLFRVNDYDPLSNTYQHRFDFLDAVTYQRVDSLELPSNSYVWFTTNAEKEAFTYSYDQSSSTFSVQLISGFDESGVDITPPLQFVIPDSGSGNIWRSLRTADSEGIIYEESGQTYFMGNNSVPTLLQDTNYSWSTSFRIDELASGQIQIVGVDRNDDEVSIWTFNADASLSGNAENPAQDPDFPSFGLLGSLDYIGGGNSDDLSLVSLGSGNVDLNGNNIIEVGETGHLFSVSLADLETGLRYDIKPLDLSLSELKPTGNSNVYNLNLRADGTLVVQGHDPDYRATDGSMYTGSGFTQVWSSSITENTEIVWTSGEILYQQAPYHQAFQPDHYIDVYPTTAGLLIGRESRELGDLGLTSGGILVTGPYVDPMTGMTGSSLALNEYYVNSWSSIEIFIPEDTNFPLGRLNLTFTPDSGQPVSQSFVIEGSPFVVSEDSLWGRIHEVHVSDLHEAPVSTNNDLSLLTRSDAFLNVLNLDGVVYADVEAGWITWGNPTGGFEDYEMGLTDAQTFNSYFFDLGSAHQGKVHDIITKGGSNENFDFSESSETFYLRGTGSVANAGEVTAVQIDLGVNDFDVLSFAFLDSAVIIDFNSEDAKGWITANTGHADSVVFRGVDAIQGSGFSDTITIAGLESSYNDVFIDIVNAGSGDDLVDATGAVDAISLVGGAGADTLIGSDFADLIVDLDGGLVTGGKGTDTFVFSSETSGGRNEITDFTVSDEGLSLSGRGNRYADQVFISVSAATLQTAGMTFENAAEFLLPSGAFTKNFLDSLELRKVTDNGQDKVIVETKSTGLKVDGLLADVQLGEVVFTSLKNISGAAPANFSASLLTGNLPVEDLMFIPDHLAGVFSSDSAMRVFERHGDFVDSLEQIVTSFQGSLDSGNSDQIQQAEKDLASALSSKILSFEDKTVLEDVSWLENFSGFGDLSISLNEAQQLLAFANQNAQQTVDAAFAESDFFEMPQIRFALEEVREGVIRGKNRAPDEPPGGPSEIISAREAVSLTPAGGVIFTLGNASEKVLGSSKADAYEIIPQAFEGINLPSGNADDTGNDVIIDLASRVSTGQASVDNDVIMLDGVRSIDDLHLYRTQVKFEGLSSLGIDYTIYGKDESNAVLTNRGDLSVFKQYDPRTDRYGVEELVLVDEFGVRSVYDLGEASRGFTVSNGNADNPIDIHVQDVLSLDASVLNNKSTSGIDNFDSFKGILVGRDSSDYQGAPDWFRLEGLETNLNVGNGVDSDIRLYGVDAHDVIELVGLSRDDFDINLSQDDRGNAVVRLSGNAESDRFGTEISITALEFGIDDATQTDFLNRLVFRADFDTLDEVLFSSQASYT